MSGRRLRTARMRGQCPFLVIEFPEAGQRAELTSNVPPVHSLIRRAVLQHISHVQVLPAPAAHPSRLTREMSLSGIQCSSCSSRVEFGEYLVNAVFAAGS